MGVRGGLAPDRSIATSTDAVSSSTAIWACCDVTHGPLLCAASEIVKSGTAMFSYDVLQFSAVRIPAGPCGAHIPYSGCLLLLVTHESLPG